MFPIGIYRHFKGKFYYARYVITDAGNGPKEEMPQRVVYWQLYGNFEPWGRPLPEFRGFKRVGKGKGQLVKRFSLICRPNQTIPTALKLEIIKEFRHLLRRHGLASGQVTLAMLKDERMSAGSMMAMVDLLQKQLAK